MSSRTVSVESPYATSYTDILSRTVLELSFGKRLVDFLLGLVLIELFSLRVRSKIGDLQTGQHPPIFSLEGDISHRLFLHG